MNRAGKDIIIPRRTYGTNPKRMSDTVAGSSGPMRTRGDILLRNTAEDSTSAVAVSRTMLLSSLVQKLREELGHLPLTIMIHNWGSESAQIFLYLLDQFLKKGDAIWLIPIKQGKINTPLPELAGVVMLDLKRPLDQRLYSNLLGDIAFFPAEDEAEATHDTKYMLPTRAVLVDLKGTEAAVRTIATHAFNNRFIAYLWNGVESVAEFRGPEDKGVLTVPEASPPKPAINEIGQRLSDIVLLLEGLIYRRRLFQDRLKEITSDSEIPDMDAALVRRADQNEWPQWAIECLPYYVPLGAARDGGKRAFVWRYVFDCLPDSINSQSIETLCHGQFHEIHMSSEVAVLAESFAKIFEDCLRPLPHLTDGAFNGTIYHAIQQIINVKYPEAAKKTKAAMEELRQLMLSNS